VIALGKAASWPSHWVVAIAVAAVCNFSALLLLGVRELWGA